MNRVYYGKVGGGKTYCVMFQEIIPALRAGRKVITNIDKLNLPELRNYIGKDIDITVRQSLKWWQESLTCDVEDDGVEGRAVLNPALSDNALYVIDEAQFIWDARQFKDTKSGFLHLLEYNRHFGVDLVFITQNVKRCDVNISRLANDSYQIKNLGFLHGFTKNRFAVNRRQTPFDKDVIAQYTRRYDSVIFTLFRSGVDVNAVKQKGRFSSTVVSAFIIFAIICLGVLFSQGNPVKAIAKTAENKKGVTTNANSPVNFLGIAPAAINQSGDAKNLKSGQSLSPTNTLSVKLQDVPCKRIGYIEANGSVWEIERCGDVIETYRNRKLVKTVTSPAGSALAEGGKSPSRDLVSNTNNSNTLKEN
ncbi:MAG: hypothetical protein HZA11_07820 [Nitrospirae bacterium]|nr:hypothetical protein [Nitrospirota bacterium]